MKTTMHHLVYIDWLHAPCTSCNVGPAHPFLGACSASDKQSRVGWGWGTLCSMLVMLTIASRNPHVESKNYTSLLSFIYSFASLINLKVVLLPRLRPESVSNTPENMSRKISTAAKFLKDLIWDVKSHLDVTIYQVSAQTAVHEIPSLDKTATKATVEYDEPLPEPTPR